MFKNQYSGKKKLTVSLIILLAELDYFIDILPAESLLNDDNVTLENLVRAVNIISRKLTSSSKG